MPEDIEEQEECRHKPITVLTSTWYNLYRFFNMPAVFFRNLWGQF